MVPTTGQGASLKQNTKGPPHDQDACGVALGPRISAHQKTARKRQPHTGGRFHTDLTKALHPEHVKDPIHAKAKTCPAMGQRCVREKAQARQPTPRADQITLRNKPTHTHSVPVTAQPTCLETDSICVCETCSLTNGNISQGTVS